MKHIIHSKTLATLTISIALITGALLLPWTAYVYAQKPISTNVFLIKNIPSELEREVLRVVPGSILSMDVVNDVTLGKDIIKSVVQTREKTEVEAWSDVSTGELLRLVGTTIPRTYDIIPERYFTSLSLAAREAFKSVSGKLLEWRFAYDTEQTQWVYSFTIKSKTHRTYKVNVGAVSRSVIDMRVV